jgi:hypothetical protein
MARNYTIETSSKLLRAITFLPNVKLVSVIHDKTIRVFDIVKRNCSVSVMDSAGVSFIIAN